MTEVAIKLCPENRNKILATEAIEPEVLDEKMEKYCGPDSVYARLGYLYYFIPQHTTFTGWVLTWSFIRSDAMEQCWTYDKSRIDTEFVEVHQHSSI